MKELVKELNLKVGDIYKNFNTLKTYRVVEIKEEEGKVKLEGLGTRNLTTTLKSLSTNYYLEVKEESKEEAKTLVEEALEEAGISTKLGKIGEKVEASKEEVKEEVKEEKIVNLRLESIENSYYLESKEEEERLLKEEIEAPMEEIEESKEVEKEIEEPKEESKEEVKEIITLRDIVEEIVKEKLLILDLEYNPNNTFKNIRKKIRRKATIIKELRLEGYGYTFKVENKEAIKEELLKILS